MGKKTGEVSALDTALLLRRRRRGVCVAALSASVIISSARFRPQLSCLDEKMAEKGVRHVVATGGRGIATRSSQMLAKTRGFKNILY